MGIEHWVSPDGPTLPDILIREQARGWLSEGLVRLYVLEGLITKFGGQFEYVEIGPATSTGVRIDAGFRPAGYGYVVSHITDVVSLAG